MMVKDMLLLPKYKKRIIVWVIAILIPVAVICPVYFCTGFGLSDSFLIPGLVYLAGCCLLFVARAGMFDTFRYQFANFLSTWKRNSPKRYEDLIQYKEIKEEKRRLNKPFYLPFLAIGLLLVVLAIIFAFVRF